MIHEDIFESRSLGNICVYIHLSNINVKKDFSNQRNKIINNCKGNTIALSKSCNKCVNG